jgi:hypothetical protein
MLQFWSMQSSGQLDTNGFRFLEKAKNMILFFNMIIDTNLA